MKEEKGYSPEPLEIKDEKTLRIYTWPELSEAVPAKGLQVEMEPGLMFPYPAGRLIGTYEVPRGVTAWGWSVKKGSWVNLIEFGGFLPKYKYVTFLPPQGITISMSVIIFLELFPTPTDVIQAFPDNTREYPPEESILDELNLAPRITIRDCSEERSVPLYEDGDAFVEITVPNSVPFKQVQAALEPGRQAARDLAEARARRKLANTVTLTVANTTCPDACNFATGKPGEVTSNLTHDRQESVRGDDQNMYVDWYSRHVANCRVEIKCRKMG